LFSTDGSPRTHTEGNAKATIACAWSSPIEGSNKRRFYAVLHLGGRRSPLDAVRAFESVQKLVIRGSVFFGFGCVPS
jgi:hypothetical protein